MKLEDIGFYTLSDDRALNASSTSPMWRAEILLTHRCNFNCAYCRGMKEYDQRDLEVLEVVQYIEQLCSHGLKNIRFSGGEPTLWKYLKEAVGLCQANGVERIALSTNGSATLDEYIKLVECGVNDFSISLDSCCASVGNAMAGRSDVWDNIVNNISALSDLTYVTVGVVLTENNYHELNDIVDYASCKLGVADIRVIPAAQIAKHLPNIDIDPGLFKHHPILRYRYNNILEGKDVRGLKETDNSHCPLVLDDLAILNGYHYPCIIYMREQGPCIGSMNQSMDDIRSQREWWYENHNCYKDTICSGNCLDVCVDYNNKARK